MAKNKPSKKAVWDALKAPVDTQTPKEKLEDELIQILQNEIWKELTAISGKTKADLDAEILAQIVKIANENR